MVDRFNKLLASYSVTRTLYDSNNGIYDILRQYIAYAVSEEHRYSFNLSWLTDMVNELGGFELKEAVIKTCLKQMKIEHTGDLYKCTRDKIRVNKCWEKALQEAKKDNDYLVNSLLSYLRDEKSEKVDAHGDDYYTRALCDYLIDGIVSSNDRLTKCISEYVIETESDVRISGILSHLKEGTVIHEGIRYCGNYSEIHSSWKGKLTIYLDTEILLGIGGYNSNMLQSYCTDFIELVQELNRNASSGNRIYLKYFNETYDELDCFFETASRIVKRLDYPDPTKEAIQQIINGCDTPSDLEQKRSLFFKKLLDLGIELDRRDFYDKKIEENIDFNIEDESILAKYEKEWKIQKNDIYRSLQMLSHINVLRKGDNKNLSFELCGAVFLTATNRTKKLAFVP